MTVILTGARADKVTGAEIIAADLPGCWQSRTMGRLSALGLGGFAFGSGISWWPLDEAGKRCAGPFHSPDEFDAWLAEQEGEDNGPSA